MNKSTNRHMNVFHHYTHDGTIPIENNLTRGLAILLQEEPALLCLLLVSMIQGGARLELPSGEYVVDIQVQAKKLNELRGGSLPDRIIGVTLTAGSSAPFAQVSPLPDSSDRNCITDIVITYDDTLIVIEAKRTDTDASAQLGEQLAAYAGTISDGERVDTERVYQLGGLGWENVLGLIEQHVDMHSGACSRLVRDYLDEVRAAHKEWLPIRTLDVVDWSDEVSVNRRIHTIMCEYLKLFNDRTHEQPGRRSGREYISLDWGYASECELRCSGDSLVLIIHIADTVSQYRCLDKCSDESFCICNNGDTIITDGADGNDLPSGDRRYDVSLTPYVTARNYYRFFGYGELPCICSDEQKRRFVEAAAEVRGRWDLERDDGRRKMCTKLRALARVFDERMCDPNQFYASVINEDKLRNKKRLDFSVGYRLCVGIPKDTVVMLEKRGKTAVEINKILSAIQKKIENKQAD